MTISRNAPCPCGSGKKFKQCCGKSNDRKPGVAALLLEAQQLQQAGRLQQAAALYQQVLAADPNQPDALHQFGLLMQRGGALPQARAMMERAVQTRPGDPVFRYNLACALYAMNAWPEAESQTRECLRLQPEWVEAKVTLATILKQTGRLTDAIALYQEALKKQPDHVVGLHNLGLALHEDKQHEAALAPLQRLLTLTPHQAESRFAFADALKFSGRFDEAQAELERILRLAPKHENALRGLADLLQLKNDMSGAEPLYRSILARSPENADIHLGLATCLLAQGKIAEGWQEYAWRMQRVFAGGFTKKRPFAHSWWQGETLTGKALLTWGEQGIGDEILFAGCIADAIQAGASVALECAPRLQTLFARSFPEIEIFPRPGQPYEAPVAALQTRVFDLQCPTGDLARWFRPSVEHFQIEAGFLRPDATRVAFWKNWLAAQDGQFSLGVSWRSMARDSVRNSFYTDLNQWGAIFRTPGISFINLQYGECEEELLEAEQLFGVSIHRPPGLNLKDDLDEAAALTRALDLAIAPKTSVFAMAGAVGTPTWLLNLDCDWTMLGTDHMPWFPSVEVFAKSWDEPWEPLLGRVAERLAEWVSSDE
jgi:tetratricopeptide (TPR) repeat protein